MGHRALPDAELSGHVERCEGCERRLIVYNPCGNRHCPKCGALTKAQWLADRQMELLPIQYFHVVFTLDHTLNPLIALNCRTGRCMPQSRSAGRSKYMTIWGGMATGLRCRTSALCTCRNVMIYLNQRLQERVHGLVYDSLAINWPPPTAS